jgi:ATP-binding cassette subfamily B protein
MRRHDTTAQLLRLLLDSADPGVRWRLACAALLVAAGGLLAALAPLALKEMVDTVGRAEGEPIGMTASAVVVMLAVYAIALGGGRMLAELRPLLAGSAEQGLLARLTRRLFGHLLALPLQFHLGRRSGDLVHRIHLTTTGCQLLVGQLVGGVIPVIVELVTVVLVLASLDQPGLVVLFFATSLFYLVVHGIGSLKIAAEARRISNASLNVNAKLADALLNLETLKCFVAENAAQEQLAAATDALASSWRSLHGLRVRIGLALAAVFTLSISASLALAAEAVAAGTLTVGGFVLANAYMLQLVRPLETLGAASREIAQAVGFIRPMLAVLSEPTEQQADPPVAGMTEAPSVPRAPGLVARPARLGGTAAPHIRFEGVSFGYDAQRTVLRSVDLDIPPGARLAIVGPSGSGKSSLTRLLLRLYDPQAGRILIDGRPIDSLARSEVRSLVCIVPQDAALFNDTLARNIALGRPLATPDEIERAARRAQLHDFIASLPQGYETLVGQRGLELSGGERQRIAIARALIKAPAILVLDEATSMLDARTEAAILDALRHGPAGCTTIMIAHRLSAVRHADRIVALEGGEIREQGTHAALLAQGGVYAELWHRQHDTATG